MKTKTKKAIIGFSAAGMLMLGLLGTNVGDASARDYEQTSTSTREYVPVESFSLNFEEIEYGFGIDLGSDDGTLEGKPAGDCVGVDACNQFIADCIGAGGKWKEEHHNPQGQPNLGHCD